jgi:hypothetical protein
MSQLELAKTRANFDRYHIVSPTDLEEAAPRLGANAEAPPYPDAASGSTEPYDGRMPDLSRVPASLPETLVYDLIMLMVRDLKVPGVSAATLRLADIRAAVQLY